MHVKYVVAKEGMCCRYLRQSGSRTDMRSEHLRAQVQVARAAGQKPLNVWSTLLHRQPSQLVVATKH